MEILHCWIVKQLWDLSLSMFELRWVMPNPLKDLLLGWGVKGRNKSLKEMWKTIPGLYVGCSGKKGTLGVLSAKQSL